MAQSTTDIVMQTAAISTVAGIGCQVLARGLKTPPILPLLLVGMALGPSGLGWVRPTELGSGLAVIVGFAVAVILFEGGLSLKMEALKARGRSIRGLVTIGALISWVGATLLARWQFGDHLGWDSAALFGALVIVTGPTVIQPLLASVRPRENVADVLRGEAVVVDPIGALAAVLTLEVVVSINSGAGSVSHALSLLGQRLALGLGEGLVGGFLIALVLRRRWMPIDLRNLLVMVSAIGLYAASELVLHESGVLTVTVAGLLLGWLDPPGLEEIEEFKIQMTALMVSLVFILLAASVEVNSLIALGSPGLIVVAGLILVVRPLCVMLSVSSAELNLRERLFVCWISPRGIIAASVSALFALLMAAPSVGMKAEGEMVRDLTFLVILGTVLIQAPTASFVARALGIVEAKPTGILFVGANRVSRALANVLFSSGIKVLLVDTSRDRVRMARAAGLPARVANILDPIAAESLNLSSYGRVFAMTTNDSVNRLSLTLLGNRFGHDQVHALRLEDSPAAEDLAHHHTDESNFPFGDLTWERLAGALREGTHPIATAVEEPTRASELASLVGEDCTPLVAIGAKGEAQVIHADKPETVIPAGSTLISWTRNAAPAPLPAEAGA